MAVKEVAGGKEQTSNLVMEAHPYGRKPTNKSSTTASAMLKIQVKTKEAGPSNKAGGADKRRKIWLPPGIGAYSSSASPYKKLS